MTVPSGNPAKVEIPWPTFNGRSSVSLALIALGLAITSSLFQGLSGALLDLLWVAAIAAGCLRLLGTEDGSRPIAVALLFLTGFASLLVVSTLWSVASPLPLPTENWSLRPSFTAIALVVATALRPLVPPRSDSPSALSGLCAIAALPAVPLALMAPLLGSGRTSNGLLLTSLQHEDGAAWISQILATFRHGHLPATAAESEFTFYPMTSASVGSVFHTLTQGRPAEGNYIIAAVDSMVASWVLCGLTLGSACLVLMLHFLPRGEAQLGFQVAAASALGSATTQVAVWVLVLNLVGLQQLSLAWAGAALATLVVVVAAAGVGQSSNLATCLAILLISTAAAASWPFGLPGIGLATVCYSVLLWRREHRRSIPLIVCLIAGLVMGVIELRQHMTAFGFTPSTLLGGRGGYIIIPGFVLAALVGALGAATASPIRRWPFRAVVATTGSLTTGAFVVWLFASSNYGPAKTAYFALLTLPLGLAIAMGWMVSHPMAGGRWLGVTVAALLVALAPETARAANLADRFLAEPPPGFGDRLIRVAEASAHHERAVCVPGEELAAYENYRCQRWVDAFSRSQSDTSLRQLWLDSQGDAAAAVSEARREGLLDGDVLFVHASWVISGSGDPRMTTQPPNSPERAPASTNND